MAIEVTRWEDNAGELHDTEEAADRADARAIIKDVLDQAQADATGGDEFDMASLLANKATLITALETLGGDVERPFSIKMEARRIALVEKAIEAVDYEGSERSFRGVAKMTTRQLIELVVSIALGMGNPFEPRAPR